MKSGLNSLRTVYMLFLIALVAGCTTRQTPQPDWAIDPQGTYPETRYLVSIGEGDTRRAAENSATAGLSRVFKTHINSQETLSETTTEQRGTIERFDQFSQLRENVRIDSKQELLNVQYGESYIDSQKRIHVVAVIPRAETAIIYHDRIAQNDQKTARLISLSDASIDALETYAFRFAACRHALENDLLLDQLDIIVPASRRQVSLHYDPQVLYSETANAAKNITFSIQFPDSGKNALRETLTGMGFSEETQNPALAFSGNASFKNVDLRRGALFFVRGHYNLNVRTRTGQSILATNGTRREGHLSYEEAADRTERSLQKEMSNKLSQELTRYFNRRATID